MDTQSKIKSLEEVAPLVRELQCAGKRIVLCHGVFDLIHLGHIRHLNAAKQHGDILVVSLTCDRFVKRGPGRPVFNENLRAEALANLACTDFVCIAPSATALQSIEAVRPDFYAKGQDYRDKEKDVTGMILEEEKAIEAVGGQLVFTDEVTFSSSLLLNSHLDNLPAETGRYLKQLSETYSAEKATAYFESLRSLKVLVVGDAIVDQYHYCRPLGKSSKESIVANQYLSEEDFAGGSLATANHVAQVCDRVSLLSVLGDQGSFEPFIRDHLANNIRAEFIRRRTAPTTVKRRYVADDNTRRKLFEICYMNDAPLTPEEECLMLAHLSEDLDSYDLVIAADFGHGAITERMIDTLAERARCLAINVQTNSANRGFNLVTRYPRADFICIDEAEARLATRDKFGPLETLIERLAMQIGAKLVVVTQGNHGSLCFSPEQGLVRVPALASGHVDLIGAGDAFFAYTAPCFAVGMPSEFIGLIGNAVGALAIQIVCNREPVSSVDVLKFITRLLKR